MPQSSTNERFDLGDVTLGCAIAGEGPLVLAAHGFPDDASTFRAQVPALVAAGFRVACPTMRGYAPSGVAASGRYDLEALGRDLVALADRLSPGAPVRLIGHDWGALASFVATALAPERFSHFATLAVPHVSGFVANLDAAQLRRSWYIGLFQLRRVAEARLAANDHALVDRLWRDWSPGYRASEEELRAVKAGIAGREREVLGYYRALASPRAFFGPSRRLLLGKVRVPAMHLHGADDGCIGVSCARGTEARFTAGHQFHVIEGAGHFLQRERPAEVNAKLLAFFGRDGAARSATSSPGGAAPYPPALLARRPSRTRFTNTKEAPHAPRPYPARNALRHRHRRRQRLGPRRQ